jgi:hypothetical protein
MKDYTPGRIFCRCSARMHTKGQAVQIYEYTPKKKKCPNCGKMRKLMVEVK